MTAFDLAVVTGLALAFWIPARRLAHGAPPVPLDDVFIHFGFARSAALGSPFCWIPENGYSSGGTSLTYPLVLAPFWLAGLRGGALAYAAAAIAIASLADLARSVRALLPRAPWWTGVLVAPLLLSVPLLDWTLFSGMEVALFAAVLGRACVALRRVEVASARDRPRAMSRLGVWSALLVATRPEAAPLALFAGVAAAHAGRSISAMRALARSTGPVALLLVSQALVNRALTGEWSAAGAVRKLVTTDPYTTPIDAAIEVIKNLTALRARALDAAMGGDGAWIAWALGLAGVLSARTRRVALPLVLGAYASIVLASFNATARFQNLRYAAPAMLMLLVAAALGAGVIASKRRLAPLASVLVIAAMIAPLRQLPVQIDLFARASRNIAEQQVEAAKRLVAMTPRPRSVLVGDAGAIPYLAELSAIDGLGLGGYKALPFARASVHGVPAVVELLERLPKHERPDVLALYPSWWAGLADVFGRPIASVKITDNVICGADEKVIYKADWSSLAAPGEGRAGAIDEIDVADLVDERAHGYVVPAPKGGWVVGASLALREGGARRFDAGRVVPEGRAESFLVRAGVPEGPLSIVIRTDGGGPLVIRVDVARGGRAVSDASIEVPARRADMWSEIAVRLASAAGGDRVVITATRGALRDFHVWLVRPESG